jgi:CheY-like chemotaxis protein
MYKVINIMLVEDDSLDRIEVMRSLEKKNIVHQLKVAKNGEEALLLLEQGNNDVFAGKPDIILLDLNMPKMNGFELLKKIRENDNWKDIKIFVLTTSDDHEDKAAVVDMGISGFITKPLKLDNPSSIDAFNLMIDLMNMS